MHASRCLAELIARLPDGRWESEACDWAPAADANLRTGRALPGLGAAAGVEDGVPDALTDQAAALATSTAAAIGHGRTLLLALTGRGDLPQHFSVIQPSKEASSTPQKPSGIW